jgi:hypothetical protein
VENWYTGENPCKVKLHAVWGEIHCTKKRQHLQFPLEICVYGPFAPVIWCTWILNTNKFH